MIGVLARGARGKREGYCPGRRRRASSREDLAWNVRDMRGFTSRSVCGPEDHAFCVLSYLENSDYPGQIGNIFGNCVEIRYFLAHLHHTT